MSQVISFRMDKENPREAQALEVLQKGQEAGYSLRHILTEALLALEAAADDEQADTQALEDVTERLAQIQSALERLRYVEVPPALPQDELPEQDTLPEAFLLSVRSAAKPGISFNRG